jgi:hypothetical protein
MLTGIPSLISDVRIRLRLPEDLILQYKKLAFDMPVLAETARCCPRVLMEMALRETMMRVSDGYALNPLQHPMCTNSLVINTELLNRINSSAKKHNMKCGQFICAALADFLIRLSKKRYEKLRKGRSGSPRGARFVN